MITYEQYREITNCFGDFHFPDFTFDEVQTFLMSCGYEMVVNHAEAKTGHWTYNMGGEAENWIGYEAMTDRILAKRLDEELPKRNDSQEAMDMDFVAVFRREIKKKILGI